LLRSVVLRLRHRAGAFLRRAGTVILAMSILIWALLSFPRVEPPAEVTGPAADAFVMAHSAAGRLGHVIEPVIRPLGYDWRIGIGLIGSFAAREVFVSTLGVVYAVEARDGELDLPLADALRAARRDGTREPVYSLATVCSLLVFYMIALQCVSTLAVVRRETGSLCWTLFQLAWMTCLAWVLAAFTYQVLAAFGHS
jgi:ferrous iron transport protein B